MTAYARKEWPIALLCAVFVIITGIVACLWVPHQINPDATAYFTIAQKYARFDIIEALNSYWGPLYSWLLVPAVWLGIGLDVAARAISVVTAGATLVLLYQFWRARGLSQISAVSLSAAAASLFAGWVLLGGTTPDMLFAFLIALLAVRLDRSLDAQSRYNALWLGGVGAALYLTKGFGFYLFLAAVLGVGLWQWWQVGRKRAFKQLLPAVIVFAVFVLPFAAALSLKYHQPMLNNTGAYVHRAFGPDVLGNQVMLDHGPLPPPNASATSVWEDPSLLLPLMPDWSPLQSHANLSYFLHKVIQRNLIVTMESINEFGALCVVAAFLLVLGCLGRGVGRTFRREFIVLTALALVMVGGYSLVLTEPRYLWPIVVLSLMGLGLWATRLEQKRLLTGLQVAIASIVIVWLYLSPLPAKLQDAHLSSTEMYTQAQALQAHLPAHTKVIADNFIEYNACYYLQLSCYAVLQTPAPGNEEAYYQQLKNADIAYFMDYHSRDTDPRLQDFIQKYFVKTDVVSTPHTHPLTPITVTIYHLR